MIFLRLPIPASEERVSRREKTRQLRYKDRQPRCPKTARVDRSLGSHNEDRPIGSENVTLTEIKPYQDVACSSSKSLEDNQNESEDKPSSYLSELDRVPEMAKKLPFAKYRNIEVEEKLSFEERVRSRRLRLCKASETLRSKGIRLLMFYTGQLVRYESNFLN